MKMPWAMVRKDRASTIATLCLACLGLPLSPGLAHIDPGAETETIPFERYATVAEIESLRTQLGQAIPQLLLSGFHTDWRTPEAWGQRQAMVTAWSQVDAEVAAFLGDWTAIEESLAIFPTATPGTVCIIDTYLGGSEFQRGMIIDGALYTDSGTVLILAGEFLGSIFVAADEASLYEYSHPGPLRDPATSGFYTHRAPEVVAAFEAHGCQVPAP